jgi:hypothetical protein
MREPGPGPPEATPAHGLTASISSRRKAFFPDGNPYLGRTARREPVRQTNVLYPLTGETCDETSSRRVCDPRSVTIP